MALCAMAVSLFTRPRPTKSANGGKRQTDDEHTPHRGHEQSPLGMTESSNRGKSHEGSWDPTPAGCFCGGGSRWRAQKASMRFGTASVNARPARYPRA